MNISECSLLKCTIAQLFFVGFLVFGVLGMTSSVVIAAEPVVEAVGEELVEPGKVDAS